MIAGGGGGKWKIDNMEGMRGETELYTFKHVYVETKSRWREKGKAPGGRWGKHWMGW